MRACGGPNLTLIFAREGCDACIFYCVQRQIQRGWRYTVQRKATRVQQNPKQCNSCCGLLFEIKVIPQIFLCEWVQGNSIYVFWDYLRIKLIITLNHNYYFFSCMSFIWYSLMCITCCSRWVEKLDKLMHLRWFWWVLVNCRTHSLDFLGVL